MKTGKYNNFIILKQKDDRGIDIHAVYYNFVIVSRFNPENNAERRLAAIDLVEKGLCSKKIAGDICGFHRNTVTKLINIKKIYGIEAVIEDNRGLKSPYKYVKKVRACIKKLLDENPRWTDQAIAKHASIELDTKISRSAVARIRTKDTQASSNNDVLSRNEELELARIADSIDRRNFDHRQMELNFKLDSGVEKDVSECSKEQPLKSDKFSDTQVIERLHEGQRFPFAGALMHHLFLQEINFENIASVFPIKVGATYQSIDILLTLFHSINLGIPSIEALKLVNAYEFGILSGMNRSPEKETIRDHLNHMAGLNLSCDLIDHFARALLNHGFIDPEVFFIDGHFLPYYGLNVIAKGYYTVRRLAMRGNELYAITDLQGRPLFFITESNEIDFRPIISRSAEKLIEYGISRPILVFDRGGYGIHYFKELNEQADFITWAKYVGDKTLKQIPDESFTVGIYWQKKKYLIAEEIRTASESLQTAKKEGRTKPTSMELRMVVIENQDTGKRIAIYTNNRIKQLHEIAFFMLNRWGESENIFKEMMSRFNLNYHPGYDIKELENQPLVDNPDVALTNKAIRILKKEIGELEKEILVMEAKQFKRKDKRRLKKLTKFNEEIVQKKKDIEGFKSKLEELDEKISIIDLLDGKQMSRCDLEKKKLYDSMQFISYNSRERLVEIFRGCYNDKRDVKQVLDMITRQAGYIRLYGQTLIIVLDRIENKKHRESAIKLCQELNKKEIKISGHLNFKLSFHISKNKVHVI